MPTWQRSMSLTTKLHLKKNSKIYYYLSPHWYFMFWQTVSARSTTGICIGLSSLDSFTYGKFPYPVYTLKVIVITKITKTFRHPRKTSNNNTVPRISQAPPNRFTPHRTCICIGLRSLDSSTRLPYPVHTLKVTSITQKNRNREFRRHLQQQQQCPQNISSSTKPFSTASHVHMYWLKLSRFV